MIISMIIDRLFTTSRDDPRHTARHNGCDSISIVIVSTNIVDDGCGFDGESERARILDLLTQALMTHRMGMCMLDGRAPKN